MPDDLPPDPKETEVRPPLVGKAPPSDKLFPCPQCGARLDFDPEHRALACPYCGYKEHIERGARQVEELPLRTYMEQRAALAHVIEGRSSEVRCTGCGAVILLEDTVATDTCPYCATHLENRPHAAESMLAPEWLIPFLVPLRKALEAFDAWLKARWFAPTTLKLFAHLGKLAGVYVPYWTFDAMTYTFYSGQRGDNYTTVEYYTDAQGRQQSRSVTRIHWTWVQGQVDFFFDDVLICASHSLPPHLRPHASYEELRDLEEFKPAFLSGMRTERYTIDPREGFRLARELMDEQIRVLCCQDIGGDHQRLHEVQTRHVGVTFKHILLPAWLAVYRYHNQTYRVVIDGRTGEVRGDRPYSWVKIVSFVLLIVAAAAALVWLIASMSR